MKIMKKMTTIFSIIIISVLFITGISVYNMESLNSLGNKMYDVNFKALEKISRVQMNLYAIDNTRAKALIVSNKNEIEKLILYDAMVK